MPGKAVKSAVAQRCEPSGIQAWGDGPIGEPVAKAAARLHGPYTLVVADPPYEYDRAESDLAALIEAGLLGEAATIVVEHSKRREWPEELGGRSRFLTRRYGDTRLSFYR